jgi:hypothetical protein
MIARTAFLLLLSTALAIAQVPLEEYSTNHVTHGPMLGLVTNSSVKVWARTHRAGSFTVRYGLSPERLDQTSAEVLTTAAHDHTGPLTLTSLQPQTEYHYQVFIGQVPSGPSGRFLTLPSADAHRERHQAVNSAGRFALVEYPIISSRRILAHDGACHIPAQRRVDRDAKALFDNRILEFLAAIRHPERVFDLLRGRVRVSGRRAPQTLRVFDKR